MWPPGTPDHVISKMTQHRDLNRKKKEIVYLKCTKAIYTHSHKPTHTEHSKSEW